MDAVSRAVLKAKRVCSLEGIRKGSIVTVINKDDIMFGLQGEVTKHFFDDECDHVTYALVRFHKDIVGRRDELRLIGNYYEGVRCHGSDWIPFGYQDRSPAPSSIRLDPKGYTKVNLSKIGT